MDPVNPWIMGAWIAVHVGAIVIAWGTRLAIGSRVESVLQLAFLAALAAVGISAAVGHHLQLTLWAPSIATLIVMVLMAVVDLRRTHEPAHAVYHAPSR